MIRRIVAWSVCGLCSLVGSASRGWGDDWSRFRGPSGSGHAALLELDDQLTRDQVLWESEVGSGTSSPVFSGDRLFVTSWKGDQRTLHCLQASDGKRLWSKDSPQLRKEAFTPPNSPATCTPVCDDRYVAVLFPDAGLCVYTLDGVEVWRKDVGPFFSMHGISASPILEDGYLVITIDQLQDAYIAALDVATGKEVWRAERLLGITGGYSTPGVMQVGGSKLIVSAAPGEMLAYDLKTGDKRLSVLGLTNAPVSIPVIEGNRIYYTEPPGKPLPMSALGDADKNGDNVIELAEVQDSVGAKRLVERIDTGFGNSDGKVDEAEWSKGFGTFVSKGGLSCVELWEEGDKLEGRVIWKYTKTTPYVPSVLVRDGLVYIINDGGVMISVDAEDGSMVSRQRLNGATGQYYASPVMAGERLVIGSVDGKLSLLTAGKNFRLLSTLDMEEPIVSSPAIYAGRLYVRTASRIHCLGKS